MPVPFRILFVCQGGLNRSALAAAIAPGVFAQHGACIETGAAAAFPGTEGRALPSAVRELVAPLHTLDADTYAAQLLTAGLASAYDYLCFLDREAASHRMYTLHVPPDRICLLHVPDPELFGQYDKAFADVTAKMKLLYTLLHEGHRV